MHQHWCPLYSSSNLCLSSGDVNYSNLRTKKSCNSGSNSCPVPKEGCYNESERHDLFIIFILPFPHSTLNFKQNKTGFLLDYRSTELGLPTESESFPHPHMFVRTQTRLCPPCLLWTIFCVSSLTEILLHY